MTVFIANLHFPRLIISHPLVKTIFFTFFCFSSTGVASGLRSDDQAVIDRLRKTQPLQLVSQISIVAVGDVMLGSWVEPVLQKEGAEYPFKATAAILHSADVSIANLEAPFTLSGDPFEKKFNFKVDPKFAIGLKSGGIDVVTLANNHIMDFGEEGLISTIKTLDSLGLKHSGAGMNAGQAHRPVVVGVKDLRIAFFGYSMTFPTEFYASEDSSGTAYPEEAVIIKNLQAWRDSVDFIVTSFHWSAEKLETPKEYQKYFAHLAIDYGADLVLGHHPHVLQGIEIYKNRLIAYSLGNFAFGSYSEYALDSIILKVYLTESGLHSAQCFPINVDNADVEFQPRLVEGQRKQAVLDSLRKLSAPLNAGVNIIRHSGLIFGDWATLPDAASNADSSIVSEAVH